jgi:hypothetical protein
MAIVMSEYFDYSGNNELTLNSTPWKRDSVGFAFFGYDELTPAMSRLVSLSYLLEFTSAFFLIGSEVNCAALRRFTPYITHVHFPFPNSQTVKKAGLSVVNKIVPEIRYDYTMSVPSRVSLTRYRVRVLRQIRKDKQIYMFSVRSMRQQFINSSLGEFALYIPKSKKFTFFSPMRLWMNALVNRYSVLEGIPKAHLLTSGFSELLLEPSDILNARSMSAIDLLDEISLNQTKQSIVCLNPY